MSDPRVQVLRPPSSGMITVRCALSEPALAEAVRQASGCALPDRRRITTAPEAAVAWMSPDELMLFVPPNRVADARAALALALEGVHSLVVDVSDARALFRLDGPGARDLLARGAPVDLDPAAFGPGDFRRTRLGQVAVAFWAVEPQVFDLMCFRSVEGFVAEWLETGAQAINAGRLTTVTEDLTWCGFAFYFRGLARNAHCARWRAQAASDAFRDRRPARVRPDPAPRRDDARPPTASAARPARPACPGTRRACAG